MPSYIESDVEEAALEWLQQVGYIVVDGPDIVPNKPGTPGAKERVEEAT